MSESREEITITNFGKKDNGGGTATPQKDGTNWWAWGLGALVLSGGIALVYWLQSSTKPLQGQAV